MRKFDYKRIEWDENNVYKNEIKHNVKYYEIEEAIENEPKCIIPHKEYKDRCVLLGRTDAGRFLYIIYQGENGGVIRPIHARDMSKPHKKFYLKNRRDYRQ